MQDRNQFTYLRIIKRATDARAKVTKLIPILGEDLAEDTLINLNALKSENIQKFPSDIDIRQIIERLEGYPDNTQVKELIEDLFVIKENLRQLSVTSPSMKSVDSESSLTEEETPTSTESPSISSQLDTQDNIASAYREALGPIKEIYDKADKFKITMQNLAEFLETLTRHAAAARSTSLGRQSSFSERSSPLSKFESVDSISSPGTPTPASPVLPSFSSQRVNFDSTSTRPQTPALMRILSEKSLGTPIAKKINLPHEIKDELAQYAELFKQLSLNPIFVKDNPITSLSAGINNLEKNINDPKFKEAIQIFIVASQASRSLRIHVIALQKHYPLINEELTKQGIGLFEDKASLVNQYLPRCDLLLQQGKKNLIRYLNKLFDSIHEQLSSLNTATSKFNTEQIALEEAMLPLTKFINDLVFAADRPVDTKIEDILDSLSPSLQILESNADLKSNAAMSNLIDLAKTAIRDMHKLSDTYVKFINPIQEYKHAVLKQSNLEHDRTIIEFIEKLEAERLKLIRGESSPSFHSDKWTEATPVRRGILDKLIDKVLHDLTAPSERKPHRSKNITEIAEDLFQLSQQHEKDLRWPRGKTSGDESSIWKLLAEFQQVAAKIAAEKAAKKAAKTDSSGAAAAAPKDEDVDDKRFRF